jgi:antitoxin component YwqK of YwqJK toxin-antitoxin module
MTCIINNEYYENGILRERIFTTKDNKKTVAFYKCISLHFEISVNSKKDGVTKEYYKSGILGRETLYSCNGIVCNDRTFHESGLLSGKSNLLGSYPYRISDITVNPIKYL